MPQHQGREPSHYLDHVPSEEIDPSATCERKERRELIRSAVDQLAEHLRVVVVLAYYQG